MLGVKYNNYNCLTLCCNCVILVSLCSWSPWRTVKAIYASYTFWRVVSLGEGTRQKV